MKNLNCVWLFLLFLLGPSSIVISMELRPKEYIVLLGYPWVGKSAIIESLLGYHINPKSQQFIHNDGKILVDTQGLYSTELREKAVKDMEKFLSQEGTYRIFFVITLVAGNVKMNDVKAINMVMDSIKHENKSINILINKVSKNEKNKIFNNDQNMKEIIETLNSGTNKIKSECVCFIDNDYAMDKAKSYFIKIDDKVKNFIYDKSLAFTVAKTEIKPNIPIVARGYEEIYQRFLEGVLIYRPDGKSDNGRIDLPISSLLHPLEDTFDISGCGDFARDLSISTGYRKGKKAANAKKIELWLTLRFLIEMELEGSASHFKDIFLCEGQVRRQAAIIITLGSDEIDLYDYLALENIEELSGNNLYEIALKACGRFSVCVRDHDPCYGDQDCYCFWHDRNGLTSYGEALSRFQFHFSD